jgi:hypothetical protein
MDQTSGFCNEECIHEYGLVYTCVFEWREHGGMHIDRKKAFNFHELDPH